MSRERPTSKIDPCSPPRCTTIYRSFRQSARWRRLRGSGSNAAYMAELNQQIAATHSAYVGAAVTEIATLRGQLSGPQLG